MTLRAIAVLATGIMFLADPVRAQDSAPRDWTGYYLGLHGGERWSKPSIPSDFLSGFVAVSGTAVAGLQFGYDGQFGNWALGGESGHWLLGAESDFDVGKQSEGRANPFIFPAICILPPGTPVPAPPGTPCLPTPGFSTGESVTQLSDMSARMRAGVIWRQWLLYATAGLAVAHVRVSMKETYRDNNPFNASSHCATVDVECSVIGLDDKILVGWTVGVGSELSIGRDISIALEYRHSDFGHETFSFTPTFVGNGAQFLRTPSPKRVALTDDRTTLRLNYRFNGP